MCTEIPQLFKQGAATKARILQTPTACAHSYPTASSADLLWVWMSESERAFEEALQCAFLLPACS